MSLMMPRGYRRAVCGMMTILLLLSTATTVFAETGSNARPFRKGSVRMSIMLGSGTAFQNDYTIFGLGVGYYVVDGLEAGLDVDAWTGNDPRIRRVSPQLRYVFQSGSAAKPYIGAFYRRTFIEGFADSDTVGARAGALFVYNRSAYFGAGLVHDVHLNCDRTVYLSCTDTYPEILIAVMF